MPQFYLSQAVLVSHPNQNESIFWSRYVLYPFCVCLFALTWRCWQMPCAVSGLGPGGGGRIFGVKAPNWNGRSVAILYYSRRKKLHPILRKAAFALSFGTLPSFVKKWLFVLLCGVVNILPDCRLPSEVIITLSPVHYDPPDEKYDQMATFRYQYTKVIFPPNSLICLQA